MRKYIYIMVFIVLYAITIQVFELYEIGGGGIIGAAIAGGIVGYIEWVVEKKAHNRKNKKQ